MYESPSHPNLVVIDKANGGKADALNAGLNLSLYPLFCAIDADSILESDALLRLVRPFIEAPGVTIAAGGVVRVANGCDVRAGRVHEVRLPRRFLPRRPDRGVSARLSVRADGWSGSNSLLIISGAFGLFDKRAAVLGRRLCHRHRGRGHGAGGPDAPPPARPQSAVSHWIRPRPDLLDRSTGQLSGAPPPAHPLAARADRYPLAAPRHDRPPPVRHGGTGLASRALCCSRC